MATVFKTTRHINIIFLCYCYKENCYRDTNHINIFFIHGITVSHSRVKVNLAFYPSLNAKVIVCTHIIYIILGMFRRIVNFRRGRVFTHGSPPVAFSALSHCVVIIIDSDFFKRCN